MVCVDEAYRLIPGDPEIAWNGVLLQHFSVFEVVITFV
jgi:hypothetical protein